jgi:hypothetical protein
VLGPNAQLRRLPHSLGRLSGLTALVLDSILVDDCLPAAPAAAPALAPLLGCAGLEILSMRDAGAVGRAGVELPAGIGERLTRLQVGGLCWWRGR